MDGQRMPAPENVGLGIHPNDPPTSHGSQTNPKKSIVGQPPFQEYNIYKVFHKKEQRWWACLVPIDKTKKRTTISYARYLMSAHLGRLLTKTETVDHINNNKIDDRIENLQILSRGDNSRKSIKRANYITLICPICKKEFSRNYKRTHFVKGNKNTFCSRPCTRKSLSKIWLNPRASSTSSGAGDS